MDETKRTINSLSDFLLPNGLRVIVETRSANGIIAMVLITRAGFRDEPSELSGMAHLLEHLSCAGDLSSEVIRGGGFANAVTYSDTTVFHSVGPARQLPLHLAHHQSRLRQPVITAEVLQHEVKVIEAEIEAAVAGQGLGAFPWFWLPAATWTDTQLRHNGYGDAESLKAMSPELLEGFWRKNYRPENCLLVVTGDVNAAAVREATGAAAGLTSPASFAGRLASPAGRGRSAAVVTNSLAKVAAAPPGVYGTAVVWQARDPAASAEFTASIVLADLLAGPDGGLLDRAVPEGDEVGAYAGVFGNPFNALPPVPWIAEAAFAAPAQAAAFPAVVANCLRLVVDDSVTSLADEIARVIDRLRLQVLRADDDLLSHTLNLGIQVLLHHPEGDAPSLGELLRGVTADDVVAAARFLLAQQQVVMHYEPRS